MSARFTSGCRLPYSGCSRAFVGIRELKKLWRLMPPCWWTVFPENALVAVEVQEQDAGQFLHGEIEEVGDIRDER